MVTPLVLFLALASPSPLEPPLAQEPDAQAGLACWWVRMGFCLVAGKTHQQCEGACDDLCFTETTPPSGPTCGPDEGPVACAED